MTMHSFNMMAMMMMMMIIDDVVVVIDNNNIYNYLRWDLFMYRKKLVYG